MLLEFPKHVLPLGYGWSLLPFKIFFPLCEIVIKNFVIIFDSHVHRAQRISLLMLTPHSWHSLSLPQGLIILRICPLVGATLVLPLAHLKKKNRAWMFCVWNCSWCQWNNSVQGLPGCLWKGDARIIQGWLQQSELVWQILSCLLLCQGMLHSITEAGDFTDLCHIFALIVLFYHLPRQL